MIDTSPLYTATNTLNAQYTAIFDNKTSKPFLVSGNETHAMLYRANMTFQEDMECLYPTGKKPKLNGQNVLTAAISLLHTDAPPEEGDFGDIDITTIDYCLTDVPYYIISTQASFENAEHQQPGVASRSATRNATFNARLQKHIRLASAHQFSLPEKPVLDIASFSRNHRFQRVLHHTEQTYMNSMYCEENMSWLKPYVRRGRMTTVFGIINELNSILPACVNCNIGLIGFQNTQQEGFIAEFMQYMTGNERNVLRFPDNGLTMHTRYSCIYNPDKANKQIHQPLTRSRTLPQGAATENPLTLSYSSRNKIVQCYANTSDIHRIAYRAGTNDTYTGDYFTSTDMKHTKKFEEFKREQRNR